MSSVAVAEVRVACPTLPRDVALPFESIEKDFRQLRDFVLNDLGRITASEEGGNYAAATIIACAYEAIADLRDGHPQGQLAFRETLPAAWQVVSPSLYNALRNGLVHGYETQTIRVAGQDLELFVAWRSGRHLSIDGTYVVLAVPNLVEGLRSAFAGFEARLRSEQALRERFRERYERGRVHEVRASDEQQGWLALLRDR
jgi:hypothetical protein